MKGVCVFVSCTERAWHIRMCVNETNLRIYEPRGKDLCNVLACVRVSVPLLCVCRPKKMFMYIRAVLKGLLRYVSVCECVCRCCVYVDTYTFMYVCSSSPERIGAIRLCQ